MMNEEGEGARKRMACDGGEEDEDDDEDCG